MYARWMGLETITPRALLELQQREAVTVIDLNAPQAWRRARVPGALNLDHERYDRSALPSDPAAALVFYCSNVLCRKAPLAARRAVRMGYENVRVMSAGIRGWISAGLPTEAEGMDPPDLGAG